VNGALEQRMDLECVEGRSSPPLGRTSGIVGVRMPPGFKTRGEVRGTRADEVEGDWNCVIEVV
jgi:hypothetical protein